MPEYLAPGVYVEEVSFRSKSIEGVGTSTAAFVGPTLTGPVGGTPELLTSFADFERIYGGVDDLAFGSDAMLNRNYVAHAVNAYFNNGGARLYVVRTFSGNVSSATAKTGAVLSDSGTEKVWFTARFPGSFFSGGTVTVQNVATPTGKAAMANAPDGSVVRVHTPAAAAPPPAPSPSPTPGPTPAPSPSPSPTPGPTPAPSPSPSPTPGLAPAPAPSAKVELWLKTGSKWKRPSDSLTEVTQEEIDKITEAYMITLNVVFQPTDGAVAAYEGLAAGAEHPRYIGTFLNEKPTRRADQLTQAIALHFETGTNLDAGKLLTALVGSQPATKTNNAYAEPFKTFTFGTGSDGSLPDKTAYEKAFDLLVGLEDISIVAAPGHSARSSKDYQGIQDALLTHVGVGRRYRIGVLDAPPDQTPSTMRDLRGLVDSTRAAMYYPWVVVNNPLAGPNSNQPAEIILPPSGFVCGIYARNDIERGVWKAPANEIVRGALRFERHINHGEQELLNPIGVNCLRYLSGRGFRVWGARTISSDPEWKYVNVRRYFNYLESSIDRGTQWVVFEPNGEMLWANVRGTISDFLLNEWKSGALLGTKQDEAYFVRCDRTTMTQNDLDNGRLICLIGVAVVKPAEFVIFRIGQKTADAKS